MAEYILTLLIGVAGGAAVGLQAPIAGAMGQRIGGTASSFVVHLSGLVFSAAWLIYQKGENIREAVNLPWYMLAAGIFGLILYQSINITLPRLGATMMIALIIVGQLMVGVLVDHFGLLGVSIKAIDLSRIAGVVALLIGAYLVAR